MRKLFCTVLLCCSSAMAQAIAGHGGLAGHSGIVAGPPPFAFINSSSNSCIGPTTCALTYSPTNTNLVIVDFFCNDTTVSQNPTITTDNGTSTWANAFANASDGGAWYENEDYTLSAAGSPTTITVHCGAATTAIGVVCREYHRTSGSWVFGGASAAAFGTSTTAIGSSQTPTASVSALISGYFLNKSNNNGFTTGNSVIRVNAGDTFHGEGIGAGEQSVFSATGSYQASANLSPVAGWTAFTSWYK